MTTHARLAVTLAALVAACGSARADTADSVDDMRRRGPAALDELLARYDAATDRAEKRRLEELIDRVAAQRYAYVSRLYWYTDLDEAKAAARASGRPILSLRLLGRLDEDLSCANSRFFRVALYANAGLSRFLRDQFVMHWSSERPAPRVVIDMGDGRRLVRTVAGNSIHYVLDAEGRPVDAIPGLRGPAAFRRELEAALPVARASADLADGPRRSILRDYHRGRVATVLAAWSRDTDGAPMSARPPLPEGTLREAERATVGKAVVETRFVDSVRLGPPGSRAPDDAAFWLALGARRVADGKLDGQSVALIHRLAPSDWSAEPRPLAGNGLARLVATFERQLAADTALNEYRAGLEIHQWFAGGARFERIEDLNRRVYAGPFLTPAADPWLGMATPGAFTGLPGDGILPPRS